MPREYLGYWETDAPLTKELEADHRPKLQAIDGALGELEGWGIRVKRLEVWIDGVEWELRLVDATTYAGR